MTYEYFIKLPALGVLDMASGAVLGGWNAVSASWETSHTFRNTPGDGRFGICNLFDYVAFEKPGESEINWVFQVKFTKTAKISLAAVCL